MDTGFVIAYSIMTISCLCIISILIGDKNDKQN